MKHEVQTAKHSAPHEHKAQAPVSIGCVVVTCSDTRTEESDSSGQLIRRLLTQHGHRVIRYHLLKDEPAEIRDRIEAAVREDAVQAIIINGGTGISRRDSTFEAIDAMLEKRLVGFGEVFRYLTFKDIGSPAIMSRATAGLYRGRVLFSTPGSESAVRLAMEKLILPELGHIIREISK
jgi:molybdenum cofactor biosynthesis protein B